MAILVKKLADNREIIFDRGRFDDWCVYITETDGTRQAPRDDTYFSELQVLSQRYPDRKVYDDFISVYDRTTNHADPAVTAHIDALVGTYHPEDRAIAELWLSVLYAGMIAEENKEGALLKKRIKRLGMYQVLVLGMSPALAAVFSKGKKWQELDALMKRYRF